MVDVARVAGVSTQTVSRALSKPEMVTSETREKVYSAAKMLGYTPNAAASYLASGNSQSIGVILTAEYEHGVAQTFNSLASAARNSGFSLIVTRSLASNIDTLRDDFDELKGYPCLATVVFASSADMASLLTATSDRLVIVGSVPRHLLCSHVIVDQRAGIANIVKHLKEQGRRRLVHMTGDLAFEDALVRRDAFLTACAAEGIRGTVVQASFWSAEEGYRLTPRVLEESPDGIVASNDTQAVGIAHGLLEAGMRIPQDVALTGFDNLDISKYLNPPLTTVEQDFQAVGEAAIALAQEIGAGDTGRSCVIPTRVIIRESSQSHV